MTLISQTVNPGRAPSRELPRHWLALLGLAALVFPTLYSIATEAWTEESGVHGPIVLATGIWLIWQRWDELKALIKPGRTSLMLLMFVPALFLYVFGRAFDFISIEVGSLILALGASAYGYLGGTVLRKIWFPILYLLFIIPLPGWFVDQITAPLKTFVSYASTGLLESLGYPVVREGVVIYVAQYQLLVEDACAGLNSLVSLTAISLFYIYILHNASWRYSLILMLWIVPVAILANIVRIILLILITYYWGNAAAQGYLHSSAGMVMFMTALLGIFGVDKIMAPIRSRLMGPAT